MEGNLKQTIATAVKEVLAQRPFPLDSVDTTQLTSTDLAGMIDHTLLKPEATPAQIDALCAEAAAHQFASVCVNPSYVPHAANQLNGASAKVCTVIGFPLGATATAVKEFETQLVIERGATEVDMVLNIGWLKAQEYQQVLEDIQTVVEAAHAQNGLVKVIIETALLTDEEKVAACLLVKQAGADFVKTSTGFSTGGATVEDIALMRATVGPQLGVKASGGVRNREDALKMIAAGATRIGASAGLKIIGAATAVSESSY